MYSLFPGFIVLGLLINGLLSAGAFAIERTEPLIIDHNCAFLDPLPVSALTGATDSLHIAYGHTSHGSQVTSGMSALAQQDTGLVGYKGDYYCWQYYPEYGTFECLDIDDYFRGGDLGHNGSTAWATSTRDYLENDPYSDDINVVMWSWCGGVSDNTPEGIQIYLDTMNDLETDYPNIHFIYMTGHRDIWNDANLKARNQQIRDYCVANNKVLYDFADIESYDPDGVYYEYANDNCDYYDSEGHLLGNWATEWQNSHVEGVDWFNCSAAHSMPLNGNRKAYAAWWMWSRLSGWEGVGGSEPENLQIERAESTVTLTWDAVPGAISYRVYSSNSPYEGFAENLTGTFAGCEWTCEIPEGIMFFKVTAEDGE